LDTDDIAYKKSVRNMVLVLAVFVITIFAAIIVPPYLFPPHDVFEKSVSAVSPYGFTTNLTINSTSVAPTTGVIITGWLNSTASSVENVTAADAWGISNSSLLSGGGCAKGWPIGVGVMQGHYTQDNYTQGSLIPILEAYHCFVQPSAPTYFIFEAHSSKALVDYGGSPHIWTIQSTVGFDQSDSEYQLQPGVYTAVFADQWGDVLTTNFVVK
jgi:hypothetical protein